MKRVLPYARRLGALSLLAPLAFVLAVLACGPAVADPGFILEPTLQGYGGKPKHTLVFSAATAKTGGLISSFPEVVAAAPTSTTMVSFKPDGGGLYDAQSLPWQTVGTVPQSAGLAYPNGFAAPAGIVAGPYTASNEYELAAGSAMSFADGSNFSICVLGGNITANENTTYLINGYYQPVVGYGATGWALFETSYSGPGAVTMGFMTNDGVRGGPGGVTRGGITLGDANVVCGGRSAAGVDAVQANLSSINTASATYVAGSTYKTALGGGGGALGNLHTNVQQVWAAPVAPSTALFTAIARRFWGMVADTGQSIFDSRSSAGDTDVVNGKRFLYPDKVIRLDEGGIRTDETSSNYFQTSQVPTTQTMTLPTGTFTGWMEGTGSVALAVGTATATGLPCTATAASDCHFAVTVGGTVTATVSGTVTFAQVEPKAARTAAMYSVAATYTRSTETVYVEPDAIDPLLKNAGTAVASPAQLAAAGTSDLTLWSNPVGATTQRLVHLASSNKWELQIAGQTVDSAATSLTAGVAPTVSWSWSTGAPVCMTVDGVKSCSAGSAATFLPGPALFINSSSSDGSNATLKTFTWDGRTSFPSITGKLACIGDSEMDPAQNFVQAGRPDSCTTLAALKGMAGVTQSNYAVYGSTEAQIAAQYVNSVKGKGFKILVAEGGVNSIATGVTAATAWGQIQPQLDDARAAGMVIALLAIAPWNGTGNVSSPYTWTSALQAQTDAFNLDLKTYAQTYPSQVVYVDIYSGMGSAADPTKQATIVDFGDSLHHSQLGYDYQAILTRNALVSLPASSFQ